MRLSDVRSKRLLDPVGRGEDAFDVALSVGVDDAAQRTYEASRLLTIWDKVDQLPEPVLDELADALHIEWYDAGAPIETKRDLVRSSDLVHAKKGTVAAVETVIRAYFGDGRIMEWPEYGGEPHHFKALTTNPSLVGENLTRFLDRLRHVKRHSSKLDSILISLTGEEWLYVGGGRHDFAHEVHAAAKEAAYLFHGAGTVDRETIRVYIGTERGLEGDLITARTIGHAYHDREHVLVRISAESPFVGDLVTSLSQATAIVQRETVTVRMTSGGHLWEPS